MFVEGGCFCGSIRYKFEANDYTSANCHCSICRRTSGAAFVSWVRVPNDCFEYIPELFFLGDLVFWCLFVFDL